MRCHALTTRPLAPGVLWLAGLFGVATWIESAAASWTLPAAADTAATLPAAVQLEAVTLEAFDVGEAALLDALRLRLVEVRVESFRGRAALADAQGLTLYARVARRDDSFVELTVIASDGRGYQRRIAAERSIEARAIAGTLAVLAHAIADGTEQPDQADAEIPDERSAEPVDGEQAPAEEQPTESPPPDEVQADTTTDDALLADEPNPQAVGDRPPEVAGWVSAGSLLRLTRPNGTGPQLAIEVGAAYRSATRHHAGVHLRYARRRAGEHVLHRYRIGVEGGHTFARGRFEAPTSLAIAVEPWSIGGVSEIYDPDGTPTAFRPLLGAAIRVRPSLHLLPNSSAGPRLTLGLLVDLGASFEVVDGFHTVAVAVPDRDTPFALGGLELVTSAVLTGWFAMPGADR